MAPGPHSCPAGPRRRSVLTGAAASAAALVAGCSAASPGAPGTPSTPGSAGSMGTAAGSTRPPRTFRGARQAGIVDIPPAHAAWVALDLPRSATRDGLRRLMRILTQDVDRVMAGRGTLTDQEPELARVAGGLTVTVSWGLRAFEVAGANPPPWLRPLPHLPIDRLQPQWSGGDLVLQVCADSPVTVAHTQRRLLTAVGSLARHRWVQRGFREPLATEHGPVRMRNLFGQVDGTVQPALDGPDDELLWCAGDAGAMRDGSAMVIRRIAMDLEGWDRADRTAREHAIGRRLDTGAPLTGGHEHTPPRLEATGPDGLPVIDTFAHVRRAMPAAPHERILRRPYNYDDPPPTGARSNSGLVFVAFCADPVRQFLPIQRRLAAADLLNLWTTPIGSSVTAVLPGVPTDAPADAYLGQPLLESA